MICSQCGHDNPQGNAFCTQCGAKLAAAAQPVRQVVAPAQQTAQPQPQAQPYAHAMNQPAMGAAGQPTQQMRPVQQAPAQQAQQPQYAYQQQTQMAYGTAQQPQYAYAPQPVYAEGPLGAAWRDITSTPGWLKRVLILCLISLVPVLNLGVIGYILKWSRDISFGKRETMPNKIFEEGEIKFGFFQVLVDIVIGAAFAIAAVIVIVILGAIFGLFSIVAAAVIVTIISVIVGILAALFVTPFAYVSSMRMVVVGQLESAFNIRKTWQAFKSKMGGAIVAVFVPNLVVSIIGAVLSAIFAAIVGAASYSGLSGIYNMYGYGYGYDMYDMPSGMVQALASMGFGVVLAAIIFAIILAMLGMFATLLSFRALGHWTARHAPQWAEESKNPDAADEISLDPTAAPHVIAVPNQPVMVPTGIPMQQQAVVYPAAQPAQQPAAQSQAQPYGAPQQSRYVQPQPHGAPAAAPAAVAGSAAAGIAAAPATVAQAAPAVAASAPTAPAAELETYTIDPAVLLREKYEAMSDADIAFEAAKNTATTAQEADTQPATEQADTADN